MAAEPFILLDDARSEGAVDAHLFDESSVGLRRADA